MKRDGIMTGHLKAIIDTSYANDTGTNTTKTHTMDKVEFMLQRKRDALNCYLRTACMRVSGDLIVHT